MAVAPSTGKRLTAEFLGTFVLVFGGCGTAVLATTNPDVGVGWLGVALAFGLTVLTMAYAIGHISGCHLNPAVTLGLWAGHRFEAREIVPYWLAQVAGAVAAAVVLLFIASGAFHVTIVSPVFLKPPRSFSSSGFAAITASHTSRRVGMRSPSFARLRK